MIQKVSFTLELSAEIEAETQEEAMETAIREMDFGSAELIDATIKVDLGEYISLAEYARRAGRADATHLRRLAEKGALPGAIKIGRNWQVPERTQIVDRRVTSGKYIGNRTYQRYIKPKRESARADRETDQIAEQED